MSVRPKTAAEAGSTFHQNKANRRALERFEAALHRVRIELKKLPDALRYPLQSTHIDSQCEVSMAVCRKHPARHPGKPRRNSAGKKFAAAQALHLLSKHRLGADTNRRGSWCKLAAVLYGEKDADLSRYCRALRDGANPGAK